MSPDHTDPNHNCHYDSDHPLLERITAIADRFTQVVLLLGGAALLIVADTTTIRHIQAGDQFPYIPTWLVCIIVASINALWLRIATLNVRQLWRQWQEWRQASSQPREPAPPSPLP